MDQLPVELLSRIAEFIDTPSQLQLRITSRYYRDVIDPLMFQHVCIGFRVEDIHGLTLLAQSSAAEHVRRLTVITEVVPILTKQEWQQKVCEALCDRWPESESTVSDELRQRSRADDFRDDEMYRALDSGYSRLELQQGWERYLTAIESQRLWHHARSQDILKASVKSFENLQTLDLRDHASDLKRELHRPGLTSDPLLSCSPFRLTLLDPGLHYKSLTGEWLVDDWMADDDEFVPGSQIGDSVKAMCRLAEALACRQRVKAVKPITDLQIWSGHHITFLEVIQDAKSNDGSTADETALAIGQEDMHNLFSSLCSVDVFLGYPLSSIGLETQKEMLRGLAEAGNLVRLDLNAFGLLGSDTNDIFGGFLDALKETPWPKLEWLTLSAVISASNLFNLVSMNASSLRILRLIMVELLHGERWDRLLEALQHVLELKEAHLHYLQCGRRRGNNAGYFMTAVGKETEVQSRVEQYLTKALPNLRPIEQWDGYPEIATDRGFDDDVEAF